MNMHVASSSTRPSRARSSKTVTALYAELLLAHASYTAARETRDFDDNATAQNDLDRDVVQPAWSKFSAIAEKLLRTPAADLTEMLLKIKVTPALNGADFRSLDELDSWKEGQDLDGDAIQTLTFLRDDLHRLAAIQSTCALKRADH